jgi:PncC family amidohydrolase
MGAAPEQRLHDVLVDREKTLATAESATGGLLGDRITGVPGSSTYYLGGVIAYANDVKEHLLGVPKEIMVEHGAVSEQTAIEMARGARKVTNADYGLSITGIAGPGGGSAEKPVGLTWVAVSGSEGDHAEKYIYSGDREQNKHAAVDSVLELLLNVLEERVAAPVQVETKRDSKDRLLPASFTWKGERFEVIDWGRHWVEQGRDHVLVRTQEGGTFELAFDHDSAAWWLIRKIRTPRGPIEAV